jgi:hypothetical protein
MDSFVASTHTRQKNQLLNQIISGFTPAQTSATTANPQHPPRESLPDISREPPLDARDPLLPS